MLRHWADLPDFMRIPEVRPYWETLNKKRIQLRIKRLFDVFAAVFLLMLLALPMAAIAVWIKIDSRGPVFYRQDRITAYGKRFRIHKFRTMVVNAEKLGTAVTVGADPRITKVGRKIRKARLDELPQLFDVLSGDMSFVGTRPEAGRYVKHYRKEYFATLLLPAGITSKTSIRYKNEEELLSGAASQKEVEDIYLHQVLPGKMRMNLESIRHFSLLDDFRTMIETVAAVSRKGAE